MPTTAGQFTQAGNFGAAAMLNRMNAPSKVESYIPPPPPVVAPSPGLQEGGPVPPLAGPTPSAGAGDETTMRVVQRVMEAIKNNETEIIDGFKEAFGEAELEQLRALVEHGIMPDETSMLAQLLAPAASPQAPPQMPVAPMQAQAGGLIPGSGSGMADDIITTADAGTPEAQDVAISSGEYVVAGDVVSGLGDGNSSNGAEVLDQLQSDVRLAKTGSPQQPPPIDLSEILPETFGGRYA